MLKKIVVLASESFTYYVIKVYVPRGRANADQVLKTPPRVSRAPRRGCVVDRNLEVVSGLAATKSDVVSSNIIRFW